jgi:hypothetical protein
LKIRLKIFRKKVIFIQKQWREALHRRRLKRNRLKHKKMARRMIANFRMMKCRRIYLDIKEKVLKIQRWWRNLKNVQQFGKIIFVRSILRTTLDRWWFRYIN